MRNRLINYRPSKTVGVEIVEESSESLWRILVVEGKKMGFTGPPDPPKSKRDDEDQDNPLIQADFFQEEPQVGKIDTEDSLLNTSVTHTKLQMRLLQTWRQATTQLDEQGINTLFLALGMLEWKPSDSAEKTAFAPLILIPAVLERTVKGSFKLVYDENDIGTNLSLSAALAEQHIKLPDIPSDLANFSVEKYFGDVKGVLKNRPDWSIHKDKVALGFFSYAKIVLYQDLDIQRWQEGHDPTSHTDVSAFLGVGYESSEGTSDEIEQVDNVRSPLDSFEVFSADSSQIKAIMEANRGISMVVEGPPGTGKSQTIANLIAECISKGKKVLFVSEKMAALEVVHRRLKLEAGLDEACLELHSQKANRRTFYSSIDQTWKLKSRLPDAASQLERLADLRQSLNQYADEIHRPLPMQGVSPRFLIGKAISLPDVEEEDLDAPYQGVGLAKLSWQDLERRLPLIEAIQAKITQIGVPAQHPFFGCSLTYLGPSEKLELERSTRLARQLLAEAFDLAEDLSKHLCVPSPICPEDITSLTHCVDIAVSAPELDGVAVKAGTWQQESKRLSEAIHNLRRLQELRSRHKNKVIEQAWGADVVSARAAYEQNADKFLKFLSGDYRKARTQLAGLLTAQGPTTPLEQRELLRELVEFSGLRSQLAEVQPVVERHFGVQWQGEVSNPDSLDRLLRWVLDLEGQVKDGLIPKSLLDFFTGAIRATGLAERSRTTSEAMASVLEKIRHLDAQLKLNRESSLESCRFEALKSQIQSFDENIERLSEIVEWNLIAEEATETGLQEILSFASAWPRAGKDLKHHILRIWLHAGIKEGFETRSALRKFERATHEEAIKEFKRLDDVLIEHNRARALHSHLQGIPSTSQLGLSAELSKQCNLRKGHKPIRWAFEQFSEFLLKIKPVVMMSPISVATFLPNFKEMFDVVIFDEASQIKPEDSLSSIARAKQAIVVGDTKQMPPTSFFDNQIDDDSTDEEAGYDTAVGKMESILALFNSIAEPSGRKTDLRWHYRSLHQALIQPSNRLFYNDRLVVFPSPIYATNERDSDLGMRFRYDPTTIYDRGSAKKKNKKQAAAVADAIVKHMAERPHESLLAVAFSKHQQEAIQDELEVRQQSDPGLFSSFNQMHQTEPLRIKNLETVQGDERDVILISVGYGPDESGNTSMNFGPINKEGGGRRLNVLMSRAKKRIEVFTSMRSGDIRIDGDNEGLSAFKTFLEFAETGILDIPNPTGMEPESIFEEEVMSALTHRGYKIDPQVGTLGFRIDLAVRHPKRPGRYAIGIECDGATYHSAKSARDRDKLREMVLVARNWKLHRIWSTDWWRDREACLKRCVSAIEGAIEATDEEEELALVDNSRSDESISIEIWKSDADQQNPRGKPYAKWTTPFELSGIALGDLPPSKMASAVVKVTAFEGPIHRNILVKRIRESCRLARSGSRIQSAIDAGISYALQNGFVRTKEDFVYQFDQTEFVARDRSSLDSSERLVEYISPEEFDLAIREILCASMAASQDEITSGIREYFGFGRTPENLPTVVAARLAQLERDDLVSNDGRFRWSGAIDN
ncbi:MAG: DUF3320 domain-containing protein [Armatimonadetes bacterium]|nr:DUF3320 domain-containing protein [Armatimonadota bacterium]